MNLTSIGADIQLAAKLLEKGSLVAIPTETVYGLAANGLNEMAVAKIFKAKNRPYFDPLILHVANLDMAQQVAEFSTLALKLAEQFWPGPLTLILPKKKIVPSLVTSGLDSVAVRIPANEIALSLIVACGFPLAAPSANPFGYLSPTTSEHVVNNLGKKIDYILEGGTTKIGIESTIVDLTQEPKILRLGGLEVTKLQSVLPQLTIAQEKENNPMAPGQLEQHYSPNTKLILFSDSVELENRITQQDALVTYLKMDLENLTNFYCYLTDNVENDAQAAANLFKTLHYLDALPCKTIYFQLAPEEGLGLAINDRLRRAAAKFHKP